MNSRAAKIAGLFLVGWGSGLLGQEKDGAKGASASAVPEFASKKLDLAECVALALAQNTEILQAKEEVRRKEGISVVVRSELLPKITGQGTFQYQNNSLSGLLVQNGVLSADELNWNAGVRVTQLLFDGGAAFSRTRAARIAQGQSMLLLQDTIDRVMLDVRRTVYTVLLNRSLIDVQTEAVSLKQEQLSSQKKRFNAGTVTKFNVLTADVELANNLPQLIRARNNKRTAEVQLARILALDYPLDVPDDWMPPVMVQGELPYQPIQVDLPSLSLIHI